MISRRAAPAINSPPSSSLSLSSSSQSLSVALASTKLAKARKSKPTIAAALTVAISTISLILFLLLATAHYTFHASKAKPQQQQQQQQQQLLVPDTGLSLNSGSISLEQQHQDNQQPVRQQIQQTIQQQVQANPKNNALSSSSSSSPHTIVTAYFQIRSKYPKETYMEWMSVMLSLQDPMIIFTTPDWVEAIQSLRPPGSLTKIYELQLDQLPLATDYPSTYWEAQLHMDPEKKRHAGYQVFWIWLSKTYFVAQAIDKNPFRSDLFMWSDIGCFRGGAAARYKNQTLVRHPQVVPRDRILFLSHTKLDQPNPPADLWWNAKLKEKEHFYHSGSQMLGYAPVWLDYHAAFEQTFAGFNDRHLFVGDDQPVFQCTCLQHPHLCAYVLRQQVKDNHYFGLRYVVFHGGRYDFWYPPTTLN